MSKVLKILILTIILSSVTGLLVKWNFIEDYFILSKKFEKPESRIEAWQQDLKYLRYDYLKVCRSFDDKTKKRFISEVYDIENNLDSLSDNQILVRIMHAVALANNAHSNVKYNYLPKIGMRASWFKEGLYITKASSSKKDHLGKRITKINHLTVDKIVSEFNDYIPGNIYNKRHSIPNLIINPGFWNGIDAGYSSNQLIIEMIDSLGQPETDTFGIEPINSALINLYWTDKPDSIFVKYKKTFDSLPLYLSSPFKSAFYKMLNDKSIYIQLNSSTNKGIVLREFADNLKILLDSNNFENIILDIRLNNGGNYRLTKKIKNHILHEVAGNDGHLYLITGNQTASASINLAASLKSKLNDNITIVGEPIGDNLIFWAEPKIFKLPNSELRISASTYQHNLKDGGFIPFKTYWGNLFCDFASNGLDVDVPVKISIYDYISYKDPVMETIKELIE